MGRPSGDVRNAIVVIVGVAGISELVGIRPGDVVEGFGGVWSTKLPSVLFCRGLATFGKVVAGGGRVRRSFLEVDCRSEWPSKSESELQGKRRTGRTGLCSGQHRRRYR